MSHSSSVGVSFRALRVAASVHCKTREEEALHLEIVQCMLHPRVCEKAVTNTGVFTALMTQPNPMIVLAMLQRLRTYTTFSILWSIATLHLRVTLLLQHVFSKCAHFA